MARQIALLRGTHIGPRSRASLGELRGRASGRARHPFPRAVDIFARYQVSFRPAEPDPEWAARLATVDVASERFVLSGREIYAWHPDGGQGSRLAKLISAPRLWGPSTARNWNTVTKLLELASE